MSSSAAASPAAATASPSSAPPLPSKAVAFGRTYFGALGGTRSVPPAKGFASSPLPPAGSAEPPSAAATVHWNRCYTWDVPPFDANDASSSSGGGRGKKSVSASSPTSSNSIAQVDATAQSTVFLTNDGRIYQTGTLHGHVYPTPTRVVVAVPRPASQVACGRHFALALLQGGVVVSWGAGHFGQLGLGASAEGGGLDPGDDHHASAAASLTFASRPVVVERLLPHIIGSPVAKLAAGDWHALALTCSGRVWAWGSNRNYQCGRKPGSSSSSSPSSHAPTLTAPLPVALEGTVIDVAAGRSHSVALLAPPPAGAAYSSSSPSSHPPQVYAWGASHHGQCGIVRRAGLGIVPPRPVEGCADAILVQVAAAGNHTLALTRMGRVLAWGCGLDGELGLGPAVPAQTTPRLIGDLDFVAIEAGLEWKRGRNNGGSTGSHRTLQHTLPPLSPSLTDPAADQDGDGTVPPKESSSAIVSVSNGSGRFGTPLPDVPRIAKVVCGPSYSAAISTSGHVYVWGSNDAGQLGVATPPSLPVRDCWTATAATSTANCPPSPGATSSLANKRTSTNRDLHVQTFDSRHNVLLPLRLEAADHLVVQHVACGPNHMWCIGTERTLEQRQWPTGRTLYEVQEDQRRINRQRARDSLLSKLHHTISGGDDEGGATTEGTTTQTDENDDEPYDGNEPAAASHSRSSPHALAPTDDSTALSPDDGGGNDSSTALYDSPPSPQTRILEPLDLSTPPFAGSVGALVATPNTATASLPAMPASFLATASTATGGESTTAEDNDDTTTHHDLSPGDGGGGEAAAPGESAIGADQSPVPPTPDSAASPTYARRLSRLPFPRVWRRLSWGGSHRTGAAEAGPPATTGTGAAPVAPTDDSMDDSPGLQPAVAPPRSGGGSFRRRRRDPRPSM